jgi:hypothetical protein
MIPHSTWNEVPAGHFLQDTHGEQIVRFVLEHAVRKSRSLTDEV